MQKRMAAEQLRALVEGAPFMVHTAAGARLQHLWLQCVSQAFCSPGMPSASFAPQHPSKMFQLLPCTVVLRTHLHEGSRALQDAVPFAQAPVCCSGSRQGPCSVGREGGLSTIPHRRTPRELMRS